MKKLKGVYFDGRSAVPRPVQVATDGHRFQMINAENALLLEAAATDIVIQPPLAQTARVMLLPGGGRFETTDHLIVTDLERQLRRNPVSRFIHRLERSWPLTMVLTVALVCIVGVVIQYAIPLVAARSARLLPPTYLEKVSQETLDFLDDRLFEPSQLDTERKIQLIDLFDHITAEIGGEQFTYRLKFRHAPQIGPNAFALPSGMIVVTDELARMAGDDKALAGVFAHEIAHIKHRHGMRSVLQNAGVFLLVTALVGDVVSITTIAATLPTLLIESGYSRRFEREADAFAGRYLVEKGWPTQPLRELLARISEDEAAVTVPSFFASHPNTNERLKKLEALEAERL